MWGTTVLSLSMWWRRLRSLLGPWVAEVVLVVPLQVVVVVAVLYLVVLDSGSPKVFALVATAAPYPMIGIRQERRGGGPVEVGRKR